MTNTEYQNLEFVREAYLGILGRAPDNPGLMMFADRLNSKILTRSQLLRSLLSSPEYLAKSASGTSSDSIGYHHSEAQEIFSKFKQASTGKPGYVTNFLGGMTDIKFVKQLAYHSGVVEQYPLTGNFHGDPIEWMGVLRAAVDAKDTFTMIELGAGWAPWSVIGYLAAKQRGIKRSTLIAIEGDEGHVGFIRASFKDNGIPSEDAKIVHGVVGLIDGTSMFPKSVDPSSAYGAESFALDQHSKEKMENFAKRYAKSIDEFVITPCHSLATLTKQLPMIDLIHCDIQGSEKELFEENIDYVTSKTKRVVIGTHSFEIERALVDAFGRRGWQLEFMAGCQMGRIGSGVPFTKKDGTQVWKNPKLLGA